MDAYAAITAQWLTVADTTRGRAAIATWAKSCPALAAYRSPADLIATINQLGHPQRSCTLLAGLLLVAEHDTLAQLAVLTALIPGLQRVVSRRWKTANGKGPWTTQADLTADAVSAAWEAIRHHAGRTHPLPARLIIRRTERRRHHAATLMAQMPGITTKELMARIGHSSPRAALIYQHATAERDRQVAAFLEAHIDATTPARPRLVPLPDAAMGAG